MVISSIVLGLIPIVHREVWSRAVTAIVAINTLGVALLEVNRRGRTILASWILVVGLVGLTTVMGFTVGGVRSPGVTMYFLFVLMAGLLLGMRAGIRVAIICAVLSLGMVFIERGGLLPQPRLAWKAETAWLLNVLYMGLVLALLRIWTDALARADRRRRESESQLRQSQKMEALGTLAGGIAHDFNNILTAIVGNAELALGDIDPANPARPALERIHRSSLRASDIVKRILLFSRRQEVSHKVIPLFPVVEEAIKLARATLPKNVMVRTAFRSELPSVSGDASQLYQVLMNLITNAAHAMSEKGGDLSVEIDAVDTTAADRKRSAALRAGRYVRVTVRDTGVGMASEVVERIFEPFFTTKGGGTGLGLSVVHGIVQDHKGAVTVESAPGAGSTFAVYLPAVAAPDDAAAIVAGRKPDVLGRGERLMYVDDEEPLIGVMERMLGVCGYRCVGFSDPAVALDAFRGNPDSWDGVITDLAMPGMSGLELARALRELRPDVPIALTTGHTHDAARVAEAGIAVRLQKPYSIETIRAAMRDLLGDPVPVP